MRNLGQQIFFLAVLTLAASINTLAQDAGMPDAEIIDNRDLESEKVVFTPGEDLRYIPKATGMAAPKDSIVLQLHDFPMQRAAQKPAERPNDKQPAKKDDSILTYNFLYYIIQKYKLQDIID